MSPLTSLISLIRLAPHHQRDETLASSRTLLGGQCCSCSWHRISHDWIGTVVSMHVFTQRAKEWKQQGRMEHTLHSAHNTNAPEHSMPLGFYPGQALTTLTEPPPFFTPRVDSHDCAVQGAGPVAGRPVLLLPMRSCHWAFGFPAVCPHRPHRHQSHTQTEP